MKLPSKIQLADKAKNAAKGGLAVGAGFLASAQSASAAVTFSTADAVTDVGTVSAGLMLLGVAVVGIAVVWGLIKKA